MKIAFVLICALVLASLSFRTYRLFQFHKEAKSNPDPQSRRIAYINYVIHLVYCLIIVFMIGWIFLGSLLMSLDDQ
jgi:hypothetical protein